MVSKMKVLNLYAGIGGNRKLWGDNYDITAVEIDADIAKIYSDFYPNDTVIVADAHQYLLDNFQEFDFIWSSPPCPSHSRARFWGSFREGYSKDLTFPQFDWKITRTIEYEDEAKGAKRPLTPRR